MIIKKQNNINKDFFVNSIYELTPKFWDENFNVSCFEILNFLFSRINCIMENNKNIDCLICFENTPLNRFNIFNDKRLKIMPQLKRKLLENDNFNSLPICSAENKKESMILDGHHRFATYQAAERKNIPNWSCKFTDGNNYFYFL